MKNPQTTDYKPRTILLGLTTTPGSDWHEKIREVDELGIKELALFPTCLEPDDRQKLYDLLETTSLESIPHVHLRDDMTKAEVDYLAKRFKTKLFNLHPNTECFSCIERLKDYKDQIFLENLGNNSMIFLKENIDKASGLCIDYSHWEAAMIINEPAYRSFAQFAKSQKIGCCHVSAINNEPKKFDWGDGPKLHYSWHTMEKLENLDYMKKYVDFLPEVISLELENSFKEQLKAKKYLEKLISG